MSGACPRSKLPWSRVQTRSIVAALFCGDIADRSWDSNGISGPGGVISCRQAIPVLPQPEPECVVVEQQRFESGPESRDGQSIDLHQRRQVPVMRVRRPALVEEPELGRRERRRAGDDALITEHGVCRCVGLARQLGDRLMAEDRDRRQVQARAVGLHDRPQGQQRVAPEVEEVVLHPDPLDAEHLLPDPREVSSSVAVPRRDDELGGQLRPRGRRRRAALARSTFLLAVSGKRRRARRTRGGTMYSGRLSRSVRRARSDTVLGTCGARHARTPPAACVPTVRPARTTDAVPDRGVSAPGPPRSRRARSGSPAS